jgi:hypothetical protein
MDDQERTDLLAAQWQQPPSVEVFRQIWKVFMHWPEGRNKDVALHNAVTRLEAWDDEMRHMTSQSGPLYSQNRVAPIGRLVRSISFYRREEGTGDLVRIADSPNAEGLRRIIVDRCDITGQGIKALARSQYLNHLTHLKFVDTYFPPGTAQELLSSPHLPALRSLDLIECGIKDDDVAVLPQSSLPARLTHFNLADNLLGDEAARTLAQLVALNQLETLDLSKNGISADARQMLRSAPHLMRTQILL